MLYLLLKHDLELFEAAETKLLHEDELRSAANSAINVYDALSRRHKDLRGKVEPSRVTGNIANTVQHYSCSKNWTFRNSLVYMLAPW